MTPDALFFDELEARLSAAVSERMVELAGVREGSRVLDLASGTGEPALRAAVVAGLSGRVLGVDLLEDRLVVARERATSRGLANTEFRALDAASLSGVDAAFDVALCRWGFMGMDAPVRAFEAVRRALRPGGVLVAAVWCELERVSWASVPRRVTSRFVALPAVEPGARGAHRYATLDLFARDLAAGGFEVTHAEELSTPIVEAADGTGIVRWVEVMLSAWAALVPGSRRDEWAQALAREAELHREGGVVRLGGVTRLVVARPKA